MPTATRSDAGRSPFSPSPNKARNEISSALSAGRVEPCQPMANVVVVRCRRTPSRLVTFARFPLGLSLPSPHAPPLFQHASPPLTAGPHLGISPFHPQASRLVALGRQRANPAASAEKGGHAKPSRNLTSGDLGRLTERARIASPVAGRPRRERARVPRLGVRSATADVELEGRWRNRGPRLPTRDRVLLPPLLVCEKPSRWVVSWGFQWILEPEQGLQRAELQRAPTRSAGLSSRGRHGVGSSTF